MRYSREGSGSGRAEKEEEILAASAANATAAAAVVAQLLVYEAEYVPPGWRSAGIEGGTIPQGEVSIIKQSTTETSDSPPFTHGELTRCKSTSTNRNPTGADLPRYRRQSQNRPQRSTNRSGSFLETNSPVRC